MLLFYIISIVISNPVTYDDLSDNNIFTSVQWDSYLPINALKDAIDLQGCLLPKEQRTLKDNFTFTPTWVQPIVDNSKVIVVGQGDGYDPHGQITFKNNLLSFKIDFNFNYDGSTGFGTLVTGQEPIAYTVNVKQNNKTVKYSELDCPIINVKASIYEIYVDGLTDQQKVEFANDLNQLEFLPQLINDYYTNVTSAFCLKLSIFIQENSLLSKITFELDSYNKPSESNPKIIKTIETIKVQGLHFQKKIFTYGLNVEIFNFQGDDYIPLDFTFFNNHQYSIGIQMSLIKTYFLYGAANNFFNTIVNSTIWPVNFFSYKTSDLRTTIPTAYYSFKLATDININCLQTSYSFKGLTNKPEENNTITTFISYNCKAKALDVQITEFDISLQYDIALKVDTFINFFIKQYQVLSLEFKEIDQYKIWSMDRLKKMVYQGLEQNLQNYQTYGSGWLKNQMVNKTSYAFTDSTLAIWSLSLF